jgi:dipeptidyl aminopeptidase/acylaminoacyl peptidase
MCKPILTFMLAAVLVACGGTATTAISTPGRPGPGVTTAPGAAPTQALTPAGLPPGGFPLLTSALDGLIVYNNGDGDIYQLQPRPGAMPQRLVAAPSNKGFLQEPIWSPDGKRIAYTYLLPFDTSGLPAQDILVANADGSTPQTVVAHQVAGEVLSGPVFSIDGKSLFYAHSNPIFKNKQITGVTLTLEQFDLQSKKVTAIVVDGTQPDISPDGKQIVFVKIDPDTFQQDLMIVGVDGKNLTQVVPGNSLGGGLNGPRWSRDGKQILFGAPNFFASLYNPTQQTGTPVAEQRANDPASSLFGWVSSWFTVSTAEAHGPPWDLWLVDADGQNLKRLTSIGEDDPSPSWSPDGKYIGFVGLAGFYIVDASGKDVRWVHREGGRGRTDWKK